MTIKALYPTIAPSLMLDFANTGALDPRISFVRTTTAVYYDGVTTAKAEENLLLQSQDFTTSWGSGNVTIGTNAATAPDGTATAETLDDDSATGTHTLFLASTTTAGLTYVASVFFKNVDRQFVTIAVSSGTNAWAAAKFDLAAGTLGSTSQAGSGWSATSSSITNVGNSWYRCSLVFVPGNGLTTFRIGLATDGTTFTAAERGLESYTGSDKVVEVWGAQLEQRSAVTAYTPTTTQPITNYIPVLQTAASGVARFDHNPTTGESLGLLIEEQRTNLALQSEEFDNAAWSKTNASVTANQVIAPNGTLTSDLFASNSTVTTSARDIRRNISATVSSAHTLSVYAKARGASFLQLVLRNQSAAANSVSVEFNLSSGVISVAAANAGTATGASASITSVGNGWYRCSLSGVADTSGTLLSVLFIGRTTSGSNTVAADTELCYIWGAQLEAGAFPTSYIPTVAATVTRNADAASMTGTNFSSWYRADEGTFYIDMRKNGNISFVQAVNLNDNSTTNQIAYGFGSGVHPFREDVTYSGSGVASMTGISDTTTLGVSYKLAGAYKTNDFAVSGNGGSVATDTVGNVPVVTQMGIGYRNTSTPLTLTGTISKIAFYPARLTNAQLQALTT